MTQKQEAKQYILLWIFATFILFPILLSFWIVNNIIDAFKIFRLKLLRGGELDAR